MAKIVIQGIPVVAATKGGKTEYWAAAIPRFDAEAAVRAQLPGWTCPPRHSEPHL
jgi:hypothetical protein